MNKITAKLYDYLVWLSEYYTTSTELSWTATLLEKLGNYKEAPEIARKCLEKKEECDREQSYSDGVKLMNSAGFSKELLAAAIQKFVFSQGWNNADKLVKICRRRIEQIMTQEEAAHLEIERRNESLRRQITVEQNRKQKYLAELADIKGLFNTKRRRELEAESAQVEKEIDRLTADLQ